MIHSFYVIKEQLKNR